MIKSFAEHPEFVLPDRNDVKMTVPFMHGYTELLVRTCHARGAFAMGGMAALIPSRRDPEANERAIAAVRADKHREANAGFDGTWVAHADVVGEAMAEFDAVLGDRPNQIERRRDDVSTDTARLLDAGSAGNSITETGLRNNVNVALRYISVWLGGRGAVAINNLMEDAATAEICRSQIWQWIRHGALLDSGARVTRELVSQLIEEELAKLSATSGDPAWEQAHADDARAVFEHVALGDELPDFLTLPAYELLH
jgi:malate synthase